VIDGCFNIVCGFMFVSFGSCDNLIRDGQGDKHGMTVQSVAGGKYVIFNRIGVGGFELILTVVRE